MVRGQALRDHVASGILEAAAALIAERGESVSMTDVATAAGVGRATLYRYFPSREALLAALLEAGLAEVAQRLADARLDDIPIPEAFARGTRAVLAGMLKYRGLGSFPLTEAQKEAADTAMMGPLRALFDRAAEEGALRSDLSREALVEVYLSLLEGIKVRVMLGGLGGLGVEPAAAAITEVFLRGALAG
ncbi:TetR family transcriptional regulator [Acrocarpospora sp. B8E8]|uniref:TetR/AcrR family transcriptional regulator n=1 Tax=Acrocarpospora sp. B8E8 TaxID=3153572 RepID=UPI00325DA28A